MDWIGFVYRITDSSGVVYSGQTAESNLLNYLASKRVPQYEDVLRLLTSDSANVKYLNVYGDLSNTAEKADLLDINNSMKAMTNNALKPIEQCTVDSGIVEGSPSSWYKVNPLGKNLYRPSPDPLRGAQLLDAFAVELGEAGEYSAADIIASGVLSRPKFASLLSGGARAGVGVATFCLSELLLAPSVQAAEYKPNWKDITFNGTKITVDLNSISTSINQKSAQTTQLIAALSNSGSLALGEVGGPNLYLQDFSQIQNEYVINYITNNNGIQQNNSEIYQIKTLPANPVGNPTLIYASPEGFIGPLQKRN